MSPPNTISSESPNSLQLIRHCTQNFNLAPDKAAISRITDSLSTVSEMRTIRLRDASDVLRQLARTHATLTSQHTDMISSHDSGRHANEVVALDTKKFRIAKSASELEVESERLESELHRLQMRLAELEEQGVEGDETARRTREAEDPTVLRLWLYRSLGISLEQDTAGNYVKATVSNGKRGDVHVVNIDPRFGRAFYSDYFWETMQG
jgi:kinetochore protein Spc24, fungi type